MFDGLFAGRDEAALIAAIEQAAREESQAAARKSAAIAELVHCTVDEDDARGGWAFDPWNNTAALVGAALGVSPKRASGQMRIALALRDRLPKIAALFCQGRLSTRLISELTWRTQLVSDDLVAVVDAALAERAATWGPLSDTKLTGAIEAVIERHDPDAVRRAQEVIRTRDVHIGACEDPNEIAALWGQLLACDAAALEARITAMVNGLCDADPRLMGERRSDAVGAIAHGNEFLACRCGSADCAAAGPAKSSVVIRVIADQAAVEAAQDLIAQQDDERGEAPSNHAAGERDSGLALLPGAKVLPVAALAEAIRGGAVVKPLWVPGPDPEPQYRPSAKLAEFVRTRDVFCRYPGCDVRAERCDIDHVVPWPYGPTHASNLNCKCRDHHLAKTFWDGWRDTQLPDGTVIWTTPAGQRYTTLPGSRLFFPAWDTTTAELPVIEPPPTDPDRTVKMPRRRRTRAADNAARIKAEREDNAAQRRLGQTPRTAAQTPRTEHSPDYGDDPPPY
ncbi:protein of unknown function DUF222 [Mycolicibacterium chubuense NBB4]|uniref:DUF222 domain-containing protein n=1 Tax=Mycolicibacterium chubuense (strain NBB4) TaxID=710421 RepID=I4BEN1_MYCCN|nr:HNH endonuclease signature motif containing protein [Mycolicibacterium chubuense]AFM15738.1 protein of unknown function DUF222 [Mycolicibacterium chubuense NBB4]